MMPQRNWQWLFWLVASGVFVVDLALKELVTHQFAIGEHREFLAGACRIYRLAEVNRGAFLAVGDRWGQWANWIFASVSVVVAGVLLALHVRPSVKSNIWLSLGLGLIVGGATGNLLDRLRFGGVRDFVQLFLPLGDNEFVPVTAVFNLADTALLTGAGLLLLATWLTGSEMPDHAGQDTPRPAAQVPS